MSIQMRSRRPPASRRAAAHLEVELTSTYPSSSPPAWRGHAHPRAGQTWEAAGPPASLDQALGSMEGSVSELRLRSGDELSSGYCSGYSGSSSGCHSEPWGGGVWGGRPAAPPPRGGSGAAGGGGAKERRNLSSQLSALFPPRTVQEIMDTHPHVADMSQLISLIQTTTPLS